MDLMIMTYGVLIVGILAVIWIIVSLTKKV